MHLLRHLLWPLALAYGLAVWFRNLLFDLGILTSNKFNVPVVSVGNLEVGGTGKSPLVLHVCGVLLEKGFRVAMLSRGYGRDSSGFLLVDREQSADMVGDEPLQCKLTFPDMTVAVSESRVDGIRRLLSLDQPPQVIVLDDAFQHRWVRPSLNILVTQAERPYWQNLILPVGSLREWRSGAARADVLVVNGGGQDDIPSGFPGLRLYCRAESGSPIQFRGKPTQLSKGDRVVLMSGIASPERFRRSAQERFDVVAFRFFPDHHRYTSADLRQLHLLFHSFDPMPKAILTTQKDAARLSGSAHLGALGDIPLFYLPISLAWQGDHGRTLYQTIIRHVEENS